MKHVMIVCDGMADEPCPELGGITPLEAARTPAFDAFARCGRTGLVATIPDGFPAGSDVAHLTLLGYDLTKVYEGRGALEAAGLGVDIPSGTLVMRCNFISADRRGVIRSHNAGHLTERESHALAAALDPVSGSFGIRLVGGEDYHYVMTVDGGDKRIVCVPPHEAVGRNLAEVAVRQECSCSGATADRLNSFVRRSHEILSRHPVNEEREREGKPAANCLLPWSPGYVPVMPPLPSVRGIRKGCLVAGTPLILGLGRYAGLAVAEVTGATGRCDTDYRRKGEAAIALLQGDADFILVHVEAPDEAGHDGDACLKRKVIEEIDRWIAAPLLEWLSASGEDVAVAILPDHPTSCRLRSHTQNPVPFVIWHRGMNPDSVERLTEKECAKGGFATVRGEDFMDLLMSSGCGG